MVIFFNTNCNVITEMYTLSVILVGDVSVADGSIGTICFHLHTPRLHESQPPHTWGHVAGGLGGNWPIGNVVF